MIKVLIVDDSELEVNILKHLFNSEPDLTVVGQAKNGQEAIELTQLLQPNIITMDIHMPVMGGIDAIRSIMSQTPTPIVVISSHLQSNELDMTYQALNAGALSVLDKPVNVMDADFKLRQKRMVETIKSMAEINVIKRRFKTTKVMPLPLEAVSHGTTERNYDLVAIGTSVGGPQVLTKILARLPKQFPVPIVIVQHMTSGFMQGFAHWLNDQITLHVKEAQTGERLQKGTVYFAADHAHLEIECVEGELYAKLTAKPPVSGFRPSATVLLNSVAQVLGRRAIGILLTGMGEDGARGLLSLKHAHAHTLVQDKESAVVFGMAGVALSMGAVDKVVPVDQMAEYLCSVLSEEVKKPG